MSPEDREALVLGSLGLVRRALREVRARIYISPFIEEDVRAAGVMGLIRAARRYRPDGGAAFSTYARRFVLGAMMDWLADWNGVVRWPREHGYKRRVFVRRPDILPLSEATLVTARTTDVEARIMAMEILDAVAPREREALLAYMRGELREAPHDAVASARARLGIRPHDIIELGRTFPVADFWRRVQRTPDGCWLWSGTVTRQGYGQFSIPDGGTGTRNWTHYLAHRVAWLLERGSVPRGARITQTCGERRCVRPDHLQLHVPKRRRLATAIAVVVSGLLLAAGCSPRQDVDAAYGVYGRMVDGQCEPPRPEWIHWRDEREEEVLVVLCLRTGEIDATVMLREPERMQKVELVLRDESKYRPLGPKGGGPRQIAFLPHSE